GGPPRPAARGKLPSADGTESPSAELDRRRRRAADAAYRGTPGRCVACIRVGADDGRQVPVARSTRRKDGTRSKAHPPVGLTFAVATVGSGTATGRAAARRGLRLPDRGMAVRRQRPPRGVRREGNAGAGRLTYDFFAAFWRLTLFACFPSAVRVFFGR